MPKNSPYLNQEPTNKENESESQEETETNEEDNTSLHYEDSVLGALIGATEEPEESSEGTE